MVATINFATGEVTITSAEERRAAAEERRAAARPVLRRVQPCMLPRPLLLAAAEKAAEKAKVAAIKARLLQEAVAAVRVRWWGGRSFDSLSRIVMWVL